ncbi:hypothetical protein LEMLEM_LOCUS2504 [Lemmus lemmus]
MEPGKSDKEELCCRHSLNDGALAVLELTIVYQADLKFTEICLPLCPAYDSFY